MAVTVPTILLLTRNSLLSLLKRFTLIRGRENDGHRRRIDPFEPTRKEPGYGDSTEANSNPTPKQHANSAVADHSVFSRGFLSMFRLQFGSFNDRT